MAEFYIGIGILLAGIVILRLDNFGVFSKLFLILGLASVYLWFEQPELFFSILSRFSL